MTRSDPRQRRSRRDDDQYVDFVNASQQRLQRTAYLMTSDWQLAADVTQEALMRVYIAWPRLDRSGGLPTYARRALVSAVIDQYRRPWRREEPTELESTLAGDVRIDERVSDREMLLAGLRRLPPRQRACVVLRYYERMSVEETAEAMRCSPGTVKSQTSRGLEALRALFEKHGRIEAATSMGKRNLR